MEQKINYYSSSHNFPNTFTCDKKSYCRRLSKGKGSGKHPKRVRIPLPIYMKVEGLDIVVLKGSVRVFSSKKTEGALR